MNTSHVLAEVAAFYHARLVAPAAAPRDLDRPSPEALALRLSTLARFVGDAGVAGDYGCGAGALLSHLRAGGFSGEYRGFDMVPSVIAAARSRHGSDTRARFATDEAVLAGAEVVLANGIFNVKLATPIPDWEAYIRATLDRIAGLAGRGFAFNMLADARPSRKQPECYYADPSRFLDLCHRRYSRDVTVLAGYGLDEFTIQVRR